MVIENMGYSLKMRLYLLFWNIRISDSEIQWNLVFSWYLFPEAVFSGFSRNLQNLHVDMDFTAFHACFSLT